MESDYNSNQKGMQTKNGTSQNLPVIYKFMNSRDKDET